MQTKLFLIITLIAMAQSGPLLATEGREDLPIKPRPSLPIIANPFPRPNELERLRAENAALKTENAALKAENAQLKADLLEYELALKELAIKLEELLQQRIDSGQIAGKGGNLQSKLNELKGLEQSLGKPEPSTPSGNTLAKKVPWKKIAKTLRLIADIIDIWAN